MPLELVEGRVYWCIQPSEESVDYGDKTPRAPWQGKLCISTNPGVNTLSLHRFNQDTGEIDLDTNAYAYVGTCNAPLVFATECEAYLAYYTKLTQVARERAEEAIDLANAAGQALSRYKQLEVEEGGKTCTNSSDGSSPSS